MFLFIKCEQISMTKGLVLKYLINQHVNFSLLALDH